MATDYELWATQHGLSDVQAVQVLEFTHSKWGSFFVTDYGQRFAGKTHGDLDFEAEPVAFEVELPKEQNSTQSEMVIRMDALSGFVMQQIRAMTDEERAEAINVIWSLYLDNDHDAPTVDPLSLVVMNVNATRIAVEMTCAASMLPNIQAGTRYTIDRYPSLAYL